MKIHNVRLGFATNSSSTHSLVFVQGARDSKVDASREFGWQTFTAVSKDVKRDYLAILLHHELRQIVHEDIAAAVVDRWVGEGTLKEGGYIDHQSMLSLPRTFNGKGVDKQFFDELYAFITQSNLAILGGNDNGDGYHKFGGSSFELPLPAAEHGTDIVAKKDPAGYWTVFNRSNGTKVRFSWPTPVTADAETPNTSRIKLMKAEYAPVPEKAHSPELIDVKITDYCAFGCEYCYMGSTVEGAHADHGILSGIIEACAQMKVFEVALGGGEPTTHPEFASLLRRFREAGVVPNFTTRSTTWLKNAKIREALKYVGGFAYSVSSAADVQALLEALKEAEVEIRLSHNNTGVAVNVQYVMGSTTLSELGSIAEACFESGLTLVLLGYKTTGRGAAFKPHDYTGWYDIVQQKAKRRWVKIGIDTSLALEVEADPELHKKVLAGAKENILYTTKEGKFSMYIDAVEKRMGPSSYCDSLHMRKLPISGSYVSDDGVKEIVDAFARW